MAVGALIAAGAGVQILSGIAQYYQAEQARGASEQRLREIEAMFDQVKPPEFDVSVMDPPNYIKTSVPPTDFDMSRVSPELYQSVGKFIPEVAPLIEEARPELVRDSEIGMEGLDAQRDALQRMREIGRGEGDPMLDARLAQASDQAQIAAQSRGESILQDAARRGTLGSGQMLAQQLQAASDAQSRAAQQGDMAAMESYRQGLQAMRDSASLGGQIRGQELDLASQNAMLMNDYNQRATRSRQAYQDRLAQMRNEAQIRNLENEQRIAEQNVDLSNEMDIYNRERLDELKDRRRSQTLGEIDRQNRIIGAEADWRRGERDRGDRLTQQKFGNEMDILSRKAGLGQQQAASAMQSTADRNRAIGGLADSLTGGASAYAGYKTAMDKEDRADRRATFNRTGKWTSRRPKSKFDRPMEYDEAFA